MGQSTPLKDGYKCVCPCHSDDKPSLSIKDTEDGKVLLHCFAGCKYSDIATKLENLGFIERDIIRYDYVDDCGNVLYTKIRYPNKQFEVEVADGKSIKDVPKVLYGLPSLPETNQGVVFIVEGEKDVDTLVDLGLSAVCLFDGASAKWLDTYTEQLKDLQLVVIPDNDGPGRDFANNVHMKCGAVILPSKTLGELVGKKDLPKGYDVTDAIEDGVDKEQLVELADHMLLGDINIVNNTSPMCEDIVIATLVNNPYLIPEASVMLLRDDFTNPVNRQIYELLLRHPLDWSGIRSKLTSLTRFPEDHLDQLEALPVSANHFPDYYEVLKEESVKRSLRSLAGEIQYRVDNGGTEELLGDIEKSITKLSTRGYESDEDIAIAVRSAIKDLDSRIDNKGCLIGKSTTIPALDEVTAGIQNKDLVIVAGRPGMGKTSFVTNLVENLAVTENERVLFFSLEMSSEQLITRMLSSLAEVDATKLRTGDLSSAEVDSIHAAATKIAKSGLIIDDHGAVDIRHILSKARRLARKAPLSMIVVDYMQLVRSSAGGSAQNRDREVTHISSSLKALAKELNVPVIALSQLNRGVESRENKRPNSSDLRESGSIEQDADLILMLYRDVVYNKDTEDPNAAEIIITKQRSGPVGTVHAIFNSSRTRFEPYVSRVEEVRSTPLREYDMDDLI